MKKYLANFGPVTVLVEIPGELKWSPVFKDREGNIMPPTSFIEGRHPATRCMVSCNLSGKVFETDISKLS